MSNDRENLSIKSVITIVFILILLISTSSIGYLILKRWVSSAETSTEIISEDISDNIYQKIQDFMNIPNHINATNKNIIENGILDFGDEQLRNKYLIDILNAQNREIRNLSYGTKDGNYYGVRRNKNDEIEIIKSNKNIDGKLYYYSVNENGELGDIVTKRDEFDPRTRVWYKEAIKAGKSIFSPTYKHLVLDELTISSSQPIYDENGQVKGVFATHMSLSSIGDYLEDIVEDYQGYAVILDGRNGNLIANSMGVDDFTILPDDTVKYYKICEIENNVMAEICNMYKDKQKENFIYKDGKNKFYVNVKNLQMDGFDWFLISTISQNMYMDKIFKSIYLTIFIILFVLLISLFIYSIVTRKLLKPMDQLLQVSTALSSGDLSKRVKVVRKDEIGIISEGLNNVADKMQFLINNLEDNVRERTEELYETNSALEESKNQLQLILNSTAEGIYGIDLYGKCTFCNISCIEALGYSSKDELLGKDMHELIHENKLNKKEYTVEKCQILESIKDKKILVNAKKVFYKVDGTPFDVEYHSYPQIKDGKVIGGVVTFMDITERKKKEDEIQYLSYHDILTGLPNRRYFDVSRKEIDIEENLPLSIIFGDINGLKMTNDIFGHTAGDELIKKSSKIIKASCREGDIVARVGGDEFIILLPKTNRKEARKILSEINNKFLNARVEAIKCSISLGFDTKIDKNQSLEEVIANAENAMYKNKTLNRRLINKNIIDTIIGTLHSRYPKEEKHSIGVSELCEQLGLALGLSKSDIDKLKRSGYLHDIGKITLDENILYKNKLNNEEMEKVHQHTLVGYRILNLFDNTMDIAEYVYSHHERWDGKGYPRGLKGKEIPLISRIISIVETYDRILNKEEILTGDRKEQALKAIKDNSGKMFDPEIVKVFLNIIKNEK